MFILDKNVISELRKVRVGKADPHGANWADGIITPDLYLSVVTVQALEIGVRSAEWRDPMQGAMLRAWLNSHVLPAFVNRILPVNTAVAQCSAKLHVPNARPALSVMDS